MHLSSMKHSDRINVGDYTIYLDNNLMIRATQSLSDNLIIKQLDVSMFQSFVAKTY